MGSQKVTVNHLGLGDIKSTMRYRDHLLSFKGLPLTVEDVRSALGLLVPALVSGQLPQTDDKVRLDLLKIWLDEFKNFGNPGTYLS